jgi:3-hydroxyacyl-CoA dehydrogenase
MAIGPLAMGDMSGLQMGYHVRQEKQRIGAYRPGERCSFVENRLFEMGRLGQKNGLGWYKYDADRRAQPDPEVTGLVRQWAEEASIPQREITEAEIVERCIYALINEGARILEEGYALRSGDIDIVYLNGYGFPAYRGGPMFYADTVGLKKVYDQVCEFHEQHGFLWEPAPLLKRLAEEGRTFSSYDQATDKIAAKEVMA